MEPIFGTNATNKQRLLKIRFTHKKTIHFMHLTLKSKLTYCIK